MVYYSSGSLNGFAWSICMLFYMLLLWFALLFFFFCMNKHAYFILFYYFPLVLWFENECISYVCMFACTFLVTTSIYIYIYRERERERERETMRDQSLFPRNCFVSQVSCRKPDWIRNCWAVTLKIRIMSACSYRMTICPYLNDFVLFLGAGDWYGGHFSLEIIS